MCEPVTMAATSAAMSYAGGAMAASSYAAVSSVGVAMVNTASLFNYSSTYGKLAGGLAATAAGYGTAAASAVGSYVSGVGVMNAVGTGLNMYSNKVASDSQLRALDYQKRAEQQRIKELKIEREEEDLAQKLKQNAIAEDYLTKLATFEATISGTGIDPSSMSYEAIATASSKNYKADSAALRGIGMSNYMNNLFESQSAMVASNSFEDAKFTVKVAGVKTLFDDAKKIYDETKQYTASQVGTKKLYETEV